MRSRLVMASGGDGAGPIGVIGKTGRPAMPVASTFIAGAMVLCLGTFEATSRAAPPASSGAGSTIGYAAKTERAANGGENADYFVVHEDQRLFFIANGVGPGPESATASKTAAETFESAYLKLAGGESPSAVAAGRRHAKQVGARLVAALRSANGALGSARGKTATAVAAVVHGDQLIVAHVGADRAYLIRDGRIVQLTRDDTPVESYRRKHPGATTEELARNAADRSPTRALGRAASLDVEIVTRDLMIGDRILLCSEGLHVGLDDHAILDLVRDGGADLAANAADLIAHAPTRSILEATVILIELRPTHR
jgi:protein phosphatase